MNPLRRSLADVLWRWRGAFVALALLSGLAALGLNLYRDRAVQPLILRAMDVAPRLTTQLALGQAQLHATALETRAGGPPAVLRQRYEAFIAGIAALRSTEERALFADLPRFEATLDRLLAFQARIDDLLGRSLDLPAAIAVDMPPPAVDEMLRLLPPLREPLVELAASAGAAHRLELVRLTRTVRVADRVQLLAAGLALGLIVLLGATVATRRRGEAAEPSAAQHAAASGGAPDPVGPSLLAAAARDIAAPLHRIAGTFGLILEQPGLDSSHARAVRAARDAADDMLASADVLLDAASLVEGRAAPAEVPFSVDEALTRAVRGLDGRIAEMGGRVMVSRDPTVPASWIGDGERVATLLRMLVLRCLPLRPGGALMLRVTQEAGGLGAEVGDPAAATLPADAFEPVDLHEAWPGEDLAEGLAAVAAFAGALGGRLVRLRAGGGRSETVRCVLPFVPATNDGVERPTRAGIVSHPLHVLAVDDVPTNRRLLAAMLERHGHSCDVAADAREALRMIGAASYDAVLMDVQMPAIDGVQATRMIRALPPPVGQVPVIAVTAHVLPEQRMAFLEAGMAAVIEKPVATSELLSALARAVPGIRGPATAPHDDNVPVIDQQTLALVRSTLAPVDFARLVERQIGAGAAALARAEAAAARGDANALDEALRDLAGAYEGLGASRVAAAVAAVLERRSDLPALRRAVADTAAQLRRRRAELAVR
ncbi:response regulator [Elioraea sp.]|uniref:response regulator n=1 Tax=Elioraea sp. TaxID=2185103 RepID=UPI003F70EF4B